MATSTAQNYHPFGTLRLFLALLVVLSHARGLGGPSIGASLEPWGIGNIGVMAFFVLSGFIISEAIHKFYWGRTGAFLSNRLLRLLPPYIFALALSVVLHVALKLGPESAFAWTNLLFQPLLPVMPAPPADSYSFVRYIWAVQVEFYFYLLCALLSVAYLRFRPTRTQAIAVVVALAVVSVAANMTGRRVLWVLAMLPYFAAGVFLYWLALERSAMAIAGLVGSAALSAAHFFGFTGRNIYSVGSWLMLAAIAATMIPLRSTRLTAGWKAIDQKLGDLSYPIYLNHFVIVTAFYTHWPWRNASAILICAATAVIVSWIAAEIVEPLTKSARDRLRGTKL